MLPCGAHPSPPDPRDESEAFHTTAIFAGVPANDATLPASVDVTAIHTYRVQPAGCCIATSIVEQVQDMAAAQGEPVPLLSQLYPYARGRILATPPVPGVGLPDTGSNYRLDAEAARDAALVADSVYSDTAENIVRVPPAKIWQVGGVAKVNAAHRIMGDETALRVGIVTALQLAATGQCSIPATVMPVDDAYANTPEDAVYAEQGPVAWGGEPVDVRPNHCQVIVAYDAARDAVAFASSWSRRLFWVSIKLLAQISFETWVISSITRIPVAA